MSCHLIQNRLTNPISGTTPDFVEETTNQGGSAGSKYITKPITLADGFDAGDLRVYLAANKQGYSEIEVFAKLLSGSDSTEFKDRPYIKLVCVNPTVSASLTDTDSFLILYSTSSINRLQSYLHNLQRIVLNRA